MASIRALDGKVLVTGIQKGERKIGSIIIADDDGKQSGIRPRWAQVHSVGQDITDISEGQWVLIEHGRWTRPLRVEDNEFYSVDNECLLAISDEAPSDEYVVKVD